MACFQRGMGKIFEPDNTGADCDYDWCCDYVDRKRRSTKDIASIIVGFGLLFVGISTMSGAVSPLKESEAFCNIFVTLGKNPFLGILAGTIVTAVIQSSSASVGILQSLAAAGLVPMSAAVISLWDRTSVHV